MPWLNLQDNSYIPLQYESGYSNYEILDLDKIFDEIIKVANLTYSQMERKATLKTEEELSGYVNELATLVKYLPRTFLKNCFAVCEDDLNDLLGLPLKTITFDESAYYTDRDFTRHSGKPLIYLKIKTPFLKEWTFSLENKYQFYSILRIVRKLFNSNKHLKTHKYF